MRIDLLAGCYGTGNSNPGTVKYDNVKLLSSTAGSTSISIPNAGFEAPVVGNGSWQYSPTGGSWTFANGGGVSGMNSAFTGSPSAAPEGVQIAFIQATGEISQSITGFQANTNYVITFSAAQRSNCCNTGGQDIQVYVDSDLKGTFHPSSGNYAEYSTSSFTTTAGSHVVKFVGLNPLGGDHTAFIDNVRINGSPKPGYGIQWLVTDQLGTPRMVFDESGSLANVKRHDYLPFGEELGATLGKRTVGQGYSASDAVRQQFTAKERDVETGLDYFQARYYSSIHGRFTSPDEFKGGPEELYTFADDAASNPTFYADITEPQSLNKYQYAYNNPLRFTDPTGHCPACEVVEEVATSPEGQVVINAAGAAATTAIVAASGEAKKAWEWFTTPGPSVEGMQCMGGLDCSAYYTAKAKDEAARNAQNQQKAQNSAQTEEKKKNLADAEKKGIPKDQLGPSGKPKVHTVNQKGGRRSARRRPRKARPGY